jgi:hypothetical protein
MSRTFQDYEVKTVDSIGAAITELLELRANGRWSFRGQRKEAWHLGLHHLPDDNRLPVCLSQFKKRCMEFPRPDYADEWDTWRWLFYAQHHRLQTRLLDWTTNPLVALYFAVENIISGCSDKKHFGAVWAIRVNDEDFLDPDQVNPSKLNRWVMINPPPVTRRIVRQSGKFSYHPLGCDSIDNRERRPEEKLVKLVLRGPKGKNPSKAIRNQLGIMNVHHASLFPDADGVARFVNAEWPDIAVSFKPELERAMSKIGKRPIRSAKNGKH